MWNWFKRDAKKKELEQVFTNIRLISFSIVGIITGIKERTWDKDRCDVILHEAQDLSSYYTDFIGVTLQLEALIDDITSLSENVNETNNEMLLALEKHLFVQMGVIKNCVHYKIGGLNVPSF